MKKSRIKPILWCALIALSVAMPQDTMAQRRGSKDELKPGQIVKTSDRVNSPFWDNATVIAIDGDNVTLRTEGTRSEIVERPTNLVKVFHVYRERQLVSYKDFFGKQFRGTVVNDDGGDKVEIRARSKTEMVERKYISTRATVVPMAEDAEAIAKGEVATTNNQTDRSPSRARDRMAGRLPARTSGGGTVSVDDLKNAAALHDAARKEAKLRGGQLPAHMMPQPDNSNSSRDEPEGPPSLPASAPTDVHTSSSSMAIDLKSRPEGNYKPAVSNNSNILDKKFVLLPTTRTDRDLAWLRRTPDESAVMVSYFGLGNDSSEYFRIDTSTGDVISAITFPKDQALLDVSPDGSLAVLRSHAFGFGENNKIFIYRITKDALEGTISFTPVSDEGASGPEADVKSAQFVDNEHLLIEANNKLQLWNIERDRPSVRWHHPYPTAGCGLAPSREVAFSATQKYIALISVPEGKVLQMLRPQEHSSIAPHTRFTSDSRHLTNCYGNWINDWDLTSPNTGKTTKLQPNTSGPAQRVNDNFYLLFDNHVLSQCRIFNAELGVVVYEYERHSLSGQIVDADSQRLWYCAGPGIGWMPTPLEDWKNASDEIAKQDLNRVQCSR